MKCKSCGKEFVSLFSNTCPYCGNDNSTSIFDTLFGSSNNEIKSNKKKKSFDPYNFDDFDNCSDDEYMDDDDYDDFDN